MQLGSVIHGLPRIRSSMHDLQRFIQPSTFFLGKNQQLKPHYGKKSYQTENTSSPKIGPSKALTLIRANCPVVCMQWLKNCNHCPGIHWVPSVTLRWTSVSVKHIRFSAIIEAGRCPWDPCMVYLPTFTIKDKPSVGEYTIHGWNGM